MLYPRQPLRFRKTIDVSDRSFTADFEVPEDYRLVVESFSVAFSLAEGQQMLFAGLSIADGETRTAFSIAPSKLPVDQFGQVLFVATESVRAYAEPGDRVRVSGVRDSAQGNASMSASVSGYLVPVDSPTLSP